MAQETGPTKAELAERIDDTEDLLEEALDPELTRAVASGEAEEGEVDLESDEESDLNDDGCEDEHD